MNLCFELQVLLLSCHKVLGKFETEIPKSAEQSGSSYRECTERLEWRQGIIKE